MRTFLIISLSLWLHVICIPILSVRNPCFPPWPWICLQHAQPEIPELSQRRTLETGRHQSPAPTPCVHMHSSYLSTTRDSPIMSRVFQKIYEMQALLTVLGWSPAGDPNRSDHHLRPLLQLRLWIFGVFFFLWHLEGTSFVLFQSWVSRPPSADCKDQLGPACLRKLKPINASTPELNSLMIEVNIPGSNLMFGRPPPKTRSRPGSLATLLHQNIPEERRITGKTRRATLPYLHFSLHHVLL